ncbi:hypothetical protein HYW44_02705 [Candidatus Daviesbacteria bacterium]|nr:hypothetical protein [Candidatus Daviesbacteria bacterium]
MTKDSEPKISLLAKSYIRQYRIGERIGLNTPNDQTLIGFFLDQRLDRAKIYHQGWFLSRPGTSVMATVPVIGWLIRLVDQAERNSRDSLEQKEIYTTEFVSEHYPTPSDKIRARQIELAINQLFAMATNKTITHKYPSFKPTQDDLEAWSGSWRPSFEKV